MRNSSEGMPGLPQPTGNYKVGFAALDITDPYRHDRVIPLRIYFPTTKGAHILADKVYEQRAPKVYPPLVNRVYSCFSEIEMMDGSQSHPLVFLAHGDLALMVDYAFIAEDLASHGYVVIAMQSQLATDPVEPAFWKERSVAKYGRIIDNILFVFEWLKTCSFKDKLDLKQVGLIGHSMGGNTLMLLMHRATPDFKMKQSATLLPHTDRADVKECVIVLDSGGMSFPRHGQIPLLLMLSQEREEYQRTSRATAEMKSIGHEVVHYKGSTHLSFMDHGYFDSPDPNAPNEIFFKGTAAERIIFFDKIRGDIRDFIEKHLG